METKHTSPCIALNTEHSQFTRFWKKTSPLRIITTHSTRDTQNLPVLKQHCGKGPDVVPRQMTLRTNKQKDPEAGGKSQGRK